MNILKTHRKKLRQDCFCVRVFLHAAMASEQLSHSNPEEIERKLFEAIHVEKPDIVFPQIEEEQYAAVLEVKRIPSERIRKYGFAFEGKRVLSG